MFSQGKIKILILVVTLLFIYINPTISKPTQNDEQEQTATTSKENDVYYNEEIEYRINYAKQMLSYMNKSVEPCEDFYEYACGNWKNVIEKKQTLQKRSNLLDIDFKILEYVEEILQNPSNNLDINYESEFKITQKFYQSCLSADLYTIKMSPEYLKVIKNIGGFPALDENWNAEGFSWFNMSAHLTNYGASGLINEFIIPQYPFPPYFKLPDLGFTFIVHSDNMASNTSNGYKRNEEEMRKYLTKYGAEESKITEVIAEIFDFWTAVLKITDQFKENIKLCKMKGGNSSFAEWENLFEIAWRGKDFNVTDDDCPCDYFYIELDKICQNHTTAVANYLSMKFLFAMDAKLKSPDYQKNYCVRNIKNTMPYVIDKLYLKAHFNNEIYEEVSNILKQIRKTLLTALTEADWLDESTRIEALLKESSMTTRIGNFEDNELTDRLIREMDNLTFVEGNYDQNNINLHEFKTYMKRYNGLHSDIFDQTTKPLELLIAAQVNAFYYNIDNSINVMAGLFNPPAYHKAWPNSLKYGTLGYLIGHEYTHGFDSIGANYDGNLEERYWWSEKSETAFQERLNCYIDHFNSYLIPEINRKVNGNQTIDENIADSGGLREALNAYRNFMKEQSKEHGVVSNTEQMPGIDLSPEQLFFLGFAQVWCASYEEEHIWQELADAHTMDKYRVLGAVTNYDEFAIAYNCSEGTKMNPKDKCRVW